MRQHFHRSAAEQLGKSAQCAVANSLFRNILRVNPCGSIFCPDQPRSDPPNSNGIIDLERLSKKYGGGTLSQRTQKDGPAARSVNAGDCNGGTTSEIERFTVPRASAPVPAPPGHRTAFGPGKAHAARSARPYRLRARKERVHHLEIAIPYAQLKVERHP